MKTISVILIFFIWSNSIAQKFEKRIFDGDTFYVFKDYDILDTNNSIPSIIPDGKWLIYRKDNRKIFEIHVKETKVDGLFKFWDEIGYLKTIGWYKNDSSWSFRKGFYMGSDSTYKVGKWSYATIFGSEMRTYNIPISQKDTNFIEIWTHDNNKLWVKWIWSKQKELIKEEVFYENGLRKEYKELINDTLLIIKEWNRNGELKCVSWERPFYYKIKYFNDSDEEPELFYRRKFPYNFEAYLIYLEKNHLSIDEQTNTPSKLVQEREFYNNGILKKETNYCSGKYSKIIIYWENNGNLIRTEYYKNDKLNYDKIKKVIQF